MLTGLPILLALAAQAAQPAAAVPADASDAGPTPYGPTEPAAPKPRFKPPAEPCKTPDVKDDTKAIVVCAPRVEGYRIDPDVMEAQKHLKNHTKPARPERLVDTSCASVGPMGCRGGAGINVIAAAVTAATMIEKAVKGENVGEMFVTDPQPSEYQLYLEAKKAREAKEAEQAAAAKAKAVAAAGATATAKSP